jgi:hypothetical protein
VDAANVFSKILFPRETGARAALAVVEAAEERFLGSTMHLVHLALVPQETATVREALQLLATFDVALVGPVMLVHVFAVPSLVCYVEKSVKNTYLHSHLRSKIDPVHS